MNGKLVMRLLMLLGVLALALPAGAAQTAAGHISLLTGRATAATAEGSIRPLLQGGKVYSGETIATGPASYLNIVFSDGGRVLLRPNTRFQIENYRYPATTRGSRGQPAAAQAQQGNAFFRLLKGGFRAITGLIGKNNRENVSVRTPVATIGIRGTDFEVRMCAGDCLDIDPLPNDGLYAGVFDGGIGITNGAGEHVTLANQFAYVAGPDTVAVPLALRPRALAQDPMPDPAACGD